MTQKSLPLLVSVNYTIDAGDLKITNVTKIDNLKSELTLVEHRSSNERGVQISYAVGARKGPEITIERPVDSEMALWQWAALVKDGQMDKARRNITITLHDSESNPRQRWTLERAYITEINGPNFTSKDGNLIKETAKIVADRVIPEMATG